MTTHGVRLAVCSRLCFSVAIALAMLRAAAADAADRITVKGNVLSGTILRANSKGIDFKTDYGKGTLNIPFEDIDNIVSENQVQVLSGEDEEVVGRILSLREGQMLVGDDEATATRVDVKTLHTAVGISPEGLTWQDRMRSYWRYWDGNVDVSYGLQRNNRHKRLFTRLRPRANEGPYAVLPQSVVPVRDPRGNGNDHHRYSRSDSNADRSGDDHHPRPCNGIDNRNEQRRLIANQVVVGPGSS